MGNDELMLVWVLWCLLNVLLLSFAQAENDIDWSNRHMGLCVRYSVFKPLPPEHFGFNQHSSAVLLLAVFSGPQWWLSMGVLWLSRQ